MTLEDLHKIPSRDLIAAILTHPDRGVTQLHTDYAKVLRQIFTVWPQFNELDIVSRSRKEPLATVRILAMATLYELGHSSPRIAAQFNRESHGTVLHAATKIRTKLAADPSLAENLQTIRTALALPPLLSQTSVHPANPRR